MEKVERKIAYVNLSPEELLYLVQKAFPDCQKLERCHLLSGGACNTAYMFKIEGSETFILRLYVRDRSYCAVEQAVYKLIEGRVAVPKLVYANEYNEPWAFAIFTFIPGDHIFAVPAKEKKMLSYKLGQTLASIHSIAFIEAGLFGKGLCIEHPFAYGSSPYFEETMKVLSHSIYVKHHLGDKKTEEVLAFVEKNKDFFPLIMEKACLTHADFKPVNLLYTSAGQVVVLDWEFAHAGAAILDFSILMRYRRQFPFDRASLVEGYLSSGGLLPKEWFRSALITDFVNIVSLLDSAIERPKLFSELKKTIDLTLHHWDHKNLS